MPRPARSSGRGAFGAKEDDILIDPTELAFELSHGPLEVDAAILRITPLLEHEIEDYSEVADLFLIRCLVDAVEPKADVHLRLSDVWVVGEDFSNQPAELAKELLRKLEVYTRVLSVLSETSLTSAGGPRVARPARMQQLDVAPSADAKGRVLEELMAVIFQSHPDVGVSQRRLRLGDQEVDLVVDNHVDHGLWERLQSRFFLVECKNWGLLGRHR